MEGTIGANFVGLTDYYTGGNVYLTRDFFGGAYFTPAFNNAIGAPRAATKPEVNGTNIWGPNGNLVVVEEQPTVVAEMVADFLGRVA
jgi:hypothetical protein